MKEESKELKWNEMISKEELEILGEEWVRNHTEVKEAVTQFIGFLSSYFSSKQQL